VRKVFPICAALVVAATLSLAPAQAASRYVVTVSASSANVTVGNSFVIRGAVGPNARGQRVKVQRRVGVSWVTVSRPLLSRTSRYAAAIRVVAPGVNLFRVVKAASNGHPVGVSKLVSVTGWRWRTIASLPLIDPGADTTVLASGTLGGQTYSPLIKQKGGYTPTRTYALDGKCTWLDAHVGATADSISTEPSLYTIDASRVPYGDTFYGWIPSFPGAFVQKDRDPVHIVRGPAEVSTIARIRLMASLEAGNGIGWGAGRVYCRS